MKLLKTEDAVGHILCHDITRIIKGVEKGPVFKKGHIIKEEDIPVLLSVGKEHIYIWENDETLLHENEAAMQLFDICKGNGLSPSEISEGKVELIADTDGLFKVNSEKLKRLNSLGEITIASRHGNIPVKKGDRLGGMRVIPLVIKKEKMAQAAQTEAPVFEIKPYILKTAGIIATGSEVKKGLIKDDFTPVVTAKLKEFGIETADVFLSGDDTEAISTHIKELKEKGVDIIICTGGMSVDPDDRTPLAIKNSGAEVVTHGAPVLPGAMLMVAYLGEVPVLGLPGCVMHSKRTVFDIILPVLAAGERIKKEDIAVMGEGGFCLNCKTCIFPDCGFGKGR